MSKSVKHLEQTFSVGDLVRLHLKLIEAGKERTQTFDGIVLAIKGRQDQKMLTVRKIAAGGIAVERTIPVDSPWLAKVEIKKPAGKVKRAKLYNLRSDTS